MHISPFSDRLAPAGRFVIERFDDMDSSTSEFSELCDRHAVFADLLAKNGPTPAWRRPPTFETVTRLVLEQQVSLASANAAFNKLEDLNGPVSPETFLSLNDDELRSVGFSRQKSEYVRGVADQILDGSLDLAAISLLDRHQAVAELVAIRGIGVWTASCFVLFVNGAPDVWPSGDRALYVSMAHVLDLSVVPTKAKCDEIASEWAPHRSAAARMLWYDYLGGRTYVPKDRAGFTDSVGMVPS
jgi:DNA-3-methyladenine glycosylase II